MSIGPADRRWTKTTTTMEDGGFLLAPPAFVRPFAPSYVLVVPLMVIFRRPLAPPPPRLVIAVAEEE